MVAWNQPLMDFVTRVRRPCGWGNRNRGLILSQPEPSRKATERSRNVGQAEPGLDDDPSVTLLLKLTFESSGYEVSEAPHGVAALIRIRRAFRILS